MEPGASGAVASRGPAYTRSRVPDRPAVVYRARMGPDDPWSPQWQPDDGRERFVRILVARRGALLAAAVWVPVALVATWRAAIEPPTIVAVVIFGSAGVALLGAGLTSAALGSRIDAIVAGIALGIGAPVAAVTSAFIAGAILDAALAQVDDLPGTILRTGVRAAVAVAPLVAVAAAAWVIGVRRYAARFRWWQRPRS